MCALPPCSTVRCSRAEGTAAVQTVNVSVRGDGPEGHARFLVQAVRLPRAATTGTAPSLERVTVRTATMVTPVKGLACRMRTGLVQGTDDAHTVASANVTATARRASGKAWFVTHAKPVLAAQHARRCVCLAQLLELSACVLMDTVARRARLPARGTTPAYSARTAERAVERPACASAMPHGTARCAMFPAPWIGADA